MSIRIDQYGWLVAVFMIALLGACGKKEGVSGDPAHDKKGMADGVYGLWNVGKYGGEALKMTINIRIESGRITATNECSAEGRTQMASASSAAEITSDEIRVRDRQNDVKYVSVGGVAISCRANIREGTMKYRVQGNKLILTLPQTGDTQELTRVS